MKKGMHVAIAAGGTGGHVFPAYALALEMERQKIKVTFFTDERPSSFALPHAAIFRIQLHKLKGLKGYVLFGIRSILSLPKIMGYLLKNKITAVVGFGGYPSVPVIAAAVMLNVPIFLHEQNAKAGRVNRLFGWCARKITISFEKTFHLTDDRTLPKCVLTGNPVRDEFAAQTKHLPLFSKNSILILGGSQGASVMANLVAPALASLSVLLKDYHIFHQSRQEDKQLVEDIYRNAKLKATVSDFFHDVPELMGRARFAIARAGASTIAELSMMGCPAILLPYPYAMDDHQRANATVVEQMGGAVMVDEIQTDGKHLASILQNMLEDNDKIFNMASCIKRLGIEGSASKICQVVVNHAVS